MKKIIFIFTAFFLLSVTATLAQENEDYFIGYYLEPNQNYYIYSDVANVRSSADIASEVKDKLQAGDEISFIENDKDGSFSSNGLIGRWLKVRYNKNNQEKEGYIWEGNISPKQLRRDSIKFVFGINNMQEDADGNRKINYQLKAVKNNKTISQSDFSNTTISFVSANIIDDSGLANTNKIVKLYFSGEACGIPSVEHYFAWNDTTLDYIDKTYSVGDADVYGYSESIIFPKAYDCYSCNTIIKFISEFDNSQNSESEETSADPLYKYKSKIYIWDGKKLILQDTNWDDQISK